MIKKFEEFIKESNTYNSDKYYDYDSIVKKLSKGPADIKQTIKNLKPEEVWVEETQSWEKVTRITGQQWAYIFHSKF
jgi:hypothetical protein